jgi:hypothetical protein
MKAITREEKIISGENLTPITRKEMFLAKASGQNIQTPTPITREEIFLSKIVGGGSGFIVCNNWQAFSSNTINDIEELKISYPNAMSVEDNAFSGCEKMVAIDLPNATSIGSQAFLGCKSLETLILRTTETVCVIDLTAFDESGFLMDSGTNRGHIYVPAVMYEYYRAGYEQPLASVLGAGAFDRIVRKIEDYPEICNGGSSSSGASAYTVSSVDELPSNAVDGSTAIVSNNDIKGDWLLNEQVAIEDGMDLYPIFTIHNLQNNSLIKITNIFAIDEIDCISLYYLDENESEYTVFDTSYNAFSNYSYRSIRVIEADAESEAWIRANGKKLPSFYICENGEWVYKGGVV